MSERCLECFRPVGNCYCSGITQIEAEIKFIFLMHPHEAYQQKTGTGRLASLFLTNSEIIIGESFDTNSRVRALIADPSFYPMVLYPGNNAQKAESFNYEEIMNGRRLLIFLIDATWREARRMMYRSPSLHKLPMLSFSREYRSRFTIKTQPKDFCLSTIESSYYLLKELQKSDLCDSTLNLEGMMKVFDKMVNFQIECRENRLRNLKVPVSII